jgi:hypothetical protein
MNTFSKPLVLVLLLLCGIATGNASLADDASATQEPGVWQKHDYRFNFLGFTTTYSCGGLADQLRSLLLIAGARPDVKSIAAACSRGYGRPDRFATAYLTFYTLAAPGADKTVDGAPVDGTWKSVNITNRSPREMRSGDCELVEQFRDQVLPLFTTRNLENRTACVPHQDSGSGYSLKFDSFTAIPKKAANK